MEALAPLESRPPLQIIRRRKVLRDMDQEKRAKTDEARAVERDGRYEDLFE